MIALIYLILSDDPLESDISKDVLLLFLIAFGAADVAFTYWVRKKLSDHAARPIGITAQGIESDRDKVLLASEISKVRVGPKGEISLYMARKKLPVRILSKRQLGNADEFIRILKNQNALLEVEDTNELIKKYQAERKAKKGARKGL